VTAIVIVSALGQRMINSDATVITFLYLASVMAFINMTHTRVIAITNHNMKIALYDDIHDCGNQIYDCH
jgi:hypothetical protein